MNGYEEVNHPKHYNDHPSGVECLTIVQAFNFNLGNVIKYVWRAGLKPGAETLKDLKKAKFYINAEIRRVAEESHEIPDIDQINKEIKKIIYRLPENTFLCFWGTGYADNPKVELVNISHFCDDNGYEIEHIDHISEMIVGESWEVPSPETLTIMRIK